MNVLRHWPRLQDAVHAGQRSAERGVRLLVRHLNIPVPGTTLTLERRRRTFVEYGVNPSDPKTPPGGDGEGEREPWDRDRYGSRQDEDKGEYGSGWDRRDGTYGQGHDAEPAASDPDGPEPTPV